MFRESIVFQLSSRAKSDVAKILANSGISSCVQLVQSVGIHVCAFRGPYIIFLTPLRYADRDAQKRWANRVVSGNVFGFDLGGLGGQMVGGLVKNSLGRVLG